MGYLFMCNYTPYRSTCSWVCGSILLCLLMEMSSGTKRLKLFLNPNSFILSLGVLFGITTHLSQEMGLSNYVWVTKYF